MACRGSAVRVRLAPFQDAFPRLAFRSGGILVFGAAGINGRRNGRIFGPAVAGRPQPRRRRCRRAPSWAQLGVTGLHKVLTRFAKMKVLLKQQRHPCYQALRGDAGPPSAQKAPSHPGSLSPATSGRPRLVELPEPGSGSIRLGQVDAWGKRCRHRSQQMTISTQLWLPTGQASAALGVSSRTLKRYADLHGFLIEGKHWRFGPLCNSPRQWNISACADALHHRGRLQRMESTPVPSACV
jgi:hypothetical protein